MAATPRLLSVGELAALAGVSSRTVRYYEALDILPPPRRSAGGARRYTADYRFYVEGALALKALGFTLDEVALVGKLALGRPATPHQRERVARIVAEHQASLRHRINVLKRVRDILQDDLVAGRGTWDLLADALHTEGPASPAPPSSPNPRRSLGTTASTDPDPPRLTPPRLV